MVKSHSEILLSNENRKYRFVQQLGEARHKRHAPQVCLFENLEFAELVYGDRKQGSCCLGPVVGGTLLGTTEVFYTLIVVVT